MRFQRRVVRFRALSAEDWVDFMRTNFGPAIQAFEYSKTPDTQADLAQKMAALIREHNSAQNGTALGNSDYLEIVATRGR